ncbi:PREDICTED: intracellular protein transport protein USO1-like [Wasmannia auropunctata]|uniref:intracellular protein transport protein USO1-like n=1 Tax=Wasmannia auropunctata TaxID=64793 RepID=UPI0005EDA0CC|nr:PREDICTED: intracellular protein transport protein USO1-like [Wasmannia auropunctata]
MGTPEKILKEVDLKTENKFLKDQKNKLEEQYKEMVNKYNELEIKSIKDQEALKEKSSSLDKACLVLKQEEKKHRIELQKVRENANKEKKNLREEKGNLKKHVVRLQKEIHEINKKYNQCLQEINKLQQDMIKSKDEIIECKNKVNMYLNLREYEKKLSKCQIAKSNLNKELKTNQRYFAESEALNLRGALNFFEKEIMFFNDDERTRGEKWQEFWKQREHKALLNKLQFSGDVKNTVWKIFNKLNGEVHQTYYKGKQVHIKKSSFFGNELSLIKAIWQCGELGQRTLIWAETGDVIV